MKKIFWKCHQKNTLRLQKHSEAWNLVEFADKKAALFSFLRDNGYVLRETGNDFVAIATEDEQRIGNLLDSFGVQPTA